MLVSVVIITRNRAHTLLRCLKSIAQQDYHNFELIVVDNGSTDDTGVLVRAHFPSAIILHQQSNMGVPGGRNIGIRYASGEVCICIDDDAEFVGSDCVRKCAEYFLKDAQLACLALRIIDEHDRLVRKLIPRRDRKVITKDSPAALFCGTGFAMRQSAFIAAGGFWEKLGPYFGEEPDLSFRLLDSGYNLLYTPHITVRHWESAMERPKGRRIYCGTRNTPWIALRSLPWYSVASLTLFGWGYFFIIALLHNQLFDFFSAVAASVRQFPFVYRMRIPISQRTRRLLWRHSGIIFY